jgi:hypothetical protein
METQSSTQLDYKKMVYMHPDYRKSKILPQSGGQTLNLIPAGGLETLFEIPVKAFNLAKSHIYFSMAPSAVAAANYWAFSDCFTPFRQIQLYTRSGVYLCDLNEVSNYTKVMWKPETKLEQFTEYDLVGNADVYSESVSRLFSRNNSVINSATTTTTAPFALRWNNTSSSISYTEPKYLEPGTNISADPTYNICIPLSAFKGTAFELDKDLFLNEIVILRIVWQQTSKIYYNGTSLTNPLTAATAMAGNVTVTNLALYLAIEKNQDIVNSLQSQVQSSGLQVLVPYVYTYKQNTGANITSYSVSYRFNRGHGRKLLKLYHSCFNNTESANTAYDHDNKGIGNASKVNVFYTMLDNERQQEYNLNTATYDDYLYLLPKLKGSVIQSSDIFYHNWVWIEDWTGYADKEKEPSNSSNLETGLDLSQERKWDMYAQQVSNNIGNVQYNLYTFAVTQKMLTVNSNGLTVI